MRLIDKDELIAFIKANGFVYANTLETFPEIDAVPVVRGEWKTWEEQFPDRTTRKKNNLGVFCSACQLHADNMTSYCPNCGAKMESEGST